MKRVGNLFARVVERDNLLLAFSKASRGKRARGDWRAFAENLEDEIERLREGLENGDYPVGEYHRFAISDPKRREICAASFGERVLHHALMNVCGPWFDRWMIADSYACRPGKGVHAALGRAAAFARRHPWALKGDFRKYFDSVPHGPLLELLGRKFKDRDVLWWFGRIVGAYETAPGRGLPIGNLTSQWLANLYLDRLDRQWPGVPRVRYMDDVVWWGRDRARLLALRDAAVAFAGEKLGLEFKTPPILQRTARGMGFLGMRVFPSGIRLARPAKTRWRRRVRALEAEAAAGVLPETALQARVAAMAAWTDVVRARGWRRAQPLSARREERSASIASCAAVPGTTTPGTAGPRTAIGTRLATATTTSASAPCAPQHRPVPFIGQSP